MAQRDAWRERNWWQQVHGFKPGTEPDWGLEPARSSEVEDTEDDQAVKAAYQAEQKRCPDTGRKFPGTL